jgi:hypothetical protein
MVPTTADFVGMYKLVLVGSSCVALMLVGAAAYYAAALVYT